MSRCLICGRSCCSGGRRKAVLEQCEDGAMKRKGRERTRSSREKDRESEREEAGGGGRAAMDGGGDGKTGKGGGHHHDTVKLLKAVSHTVELRNFGFSSNELLHPEPDIQQPSILSPGNLLHWGKFLYLRKLLLREVLLLLDKVLLVDPDGQIWLRPAAPCTWRVPSPGSSARSFSWILIAWIWLRRAPPGTGRGSPARGQGPRGS